MLFTLLGLLSLASCVEDATEGPHTAEMYYVDLVYALHHNDQRGAEEAARRFTRSFTALETGSRGFRSGEEVEEQRYYLSRAERTYAKVRTSIGVGNLEQALIQLWRATEELRAARIPNLEELYIAGIYDFVVAWLEVSSASRADHLSSGEWRALTRRIKSSHAEWRRCRSVTPSPSIYYFSVEDAGDFRHAHDGVDRLLDSLQASLSDQPEAIVRSYIDATDSAIWALIRRFGSPGRAGLELTSPETTMELEGPSRRYSLRARMGLFRPAPVYRSPSSPIWPTQS